MVIWHCYWEYYIRKVISIGAMSRQLASSPNIDWTCEQWCIYSQGLSKWQYGFNGAEQGAWWLTQLSEFVDVTRGLKQSWQYPQRPLMSQTDPNLTKLKLFLPFHWFCKNCGNQSSNSVLTKLPISNYNNRSVNQKLNEDFFFP